jgi:fructosamine-3-kinase
MNKYLLEFIIEKISIHFNTKITLVDVKQVYGGDINKTFQLTTSAGRYFIKTNDHAPKDMFEKEFNGLRLLKQCNHIAVPEALFFGEKDEVRFLVMEFIAKGNPANDFWKQFATGLASLHKQTQAKFGLNENNYIGSLQQENNYCSTWAEFYNIHRVMPLVKKAFDENKYSKQDTQMAEKLCSKFDLLFPVDAPALLHGDLWGGNFMVNETGLAVIYDPAVYYGHREMDIAMTLLFGGFDKKLYLHYNEIFPLEKNWLQRIELCQLYPLLVHLVLFGGHYYSSVMSIIKKYV